MVKNFKCVRCGACCRWQGYVRLKGEEIERIAGFLGITTQEFIDEYTYLTHDRKSLSLVDQEDGTCVFYRPGEPPACFIQDVKPEQCIGFPEKWAHEGWEDDCGGAIEARRKARSKE